MTRAILAIILWTSITVCLVVGSKVRTCYSCEGVNCGRTSRTTATEQCLNSLDYCVTVFDGFTVVRKGCSLNVPSHLRSRCDANTAECHKCYTDHCNNLGQANYECLECDSSKDANCAKNAASIMPTRCAAPTAPNSYCFVKYENNVTKRGCATSLREQRNCQADANCRLCLADDLRGCNMSDFKK